jgi:hypothetical protein
MAVFQQEGRVEKGCLVMMALLTAGVAFLSGQTPEGAAFRIEKLDPALDEIIHHCLHALV